MTGPSQIDAVGFLSGDPGMKAVILSRDWSDSTLGHPAAWPHALKVALGICLGSEMPMAILWGTAPHMLYNDAWRDLMGDEHAQKVGKTAEEVWPLDWHRLADAFGQVLSGGDAMAAFENRLDCLHDEDVAARYRFSGTCIRDQDGSVAGVLKQAREVAEAAVQAAEHARFLLALSDALQEAPTPAAAAAAAADRLVEKLGLALAVVAAPLGDAGTGRCRVLAAAGDAAPAPGAPISLLGRAAQPLYLSDVADTPDLLAVPVEAGSIGAFASVPYHDEAGLHVLLHAGRAAPGRWSAAERELLTQAAQRLAAAFARLAMEDDAGAQTRTLDALNRLGADLNTASQNLDGLLTLFIDTATRLTGAAYGAYFERIPSPADGAAEDVWRLGALVGAPREAFTRFGMPRQTALFQPTFMGDGPVRSDDVSRDPRFGSLGGMPEGHLPVRSYLALPVISLTGERLGALLLGSPQPGMFGEREEHMVAAFAGMTSVAIDNARLYRASQHEISERTRVEDALRELNETLEQRIEERTEALAQAEEQLRQSQKMEAVGQLTGGLAHDFNNLLTGITGNLEVLQTRLHQGRTTDFGRYIASAHEAARRAASLTHRLLAFSRRQTLNPKPVELNLLIREMQDLIGRTVGPSVALEVVSAPGLWQVMADPNQLENALLNLCLNARDAMPNGGRLILETCNRFLDVPAAQSRDLPTGQYVALSVSDNGAGMTPDVVRRAFDPFFTTKPIGQGTGLGLSMIYGFVRQSGGLARIYSEPEKGTTVTLYLPRLMQEVAAPEPAPHRPAAASADQGDVVLVVDDEPSVRMLITEILADNGYATLEAADAAAGLRILQSDARIDLLVSDVGLPGGMNGRQMADAGRESRPNLKVLFITGYAENAVLSHGHLFPWMHVLTKPFTMDALASRIADLLHPAGRD